MRRGSNVIVIHPGSRFLRIGRACDLNPVMVPNCIARKTAPPVPATVYIENISRPRKSASKDSDAQNGDEKSNTPTEDDSVG
jgi:actin-related protein 8